MTQPRQLRYLLLIAVTGTLLYGVQLLIDVARPMADFVEPVVGLLGAAWPTQVKVTFWAVVSSWLLVLAGWGLAVRWYRDRSTLTVLTVVVLLLPFTFSPAFTVFGHPATLLICLPSTAFGLWLVRRMQRYRRMPLALPLAVFGWGAFVGVGFGGSMNLWVFDYAPRYLLGQGGDLVRIAHEVYTGTVASAGVFEELGKGAGVAVAYLLFRRHVDDVVSGIVLGASAGLGFNLVETVEYISAAQGGGAETQYWLRQSVGLMAAHTAFTAIIGAGFGVASQLRERRLRLITIGCGYLCGAGAHFANDVLLPWLNQLERTWLNPGPIVDVLVGQPLVLLILQGPLVVAYLLLLRRGLRSQVAVLADRLRAEAATGNGAVIDPEIPILLKPAARFRFKVTALRRYGPAPYRTLSRLHAAQYELAMQRGHRADELRERIHQLRAELRAAVTAAEVRPVGEAA